MAASLTVAFGPTQTPTVRDSTQTTMTAALAAIPATSSPRDGRRTTPTAHSIWNQAKTMKNRPYSQYSARCDGE